MTDFYAAWQESKPADRRDECTPNCSSGGEWLRLERVSPAPHVGWIWCCRQKNCPLYAADRVLAAELTDFRSR